jgi:hypothetical protein
MMLTTPDNTLKILTTVLVLVLSSLACMEQVATPAPAVSPSPAPTASPAPSATIAPSVTPRATAEDVQSATVAIVRQPTVNVRDAAGGDPTGEYVTAGQEVTVLEIDGDWVRIAEPEGWLFIGCLRDLSEKGCLAE